MLQQRLLAARMRLHPLRYAAKARSEPQTHDVGDTFPSASEPTESCCFSHRRFNFYAQPYAVQPGEVEVSKSRTRRVRQTAIEAGMPDPVVLPKVYLVFCNLCKRDVDCVQWELASRQQGIGLRANLQFPCQINQAVPLE